MWRIVQGILHFYLAPLVTAPCRRMERHYTYAVRLVLVHGHAARWSLAETHVLLPANRRRIGKHTGIAQAPAAGRTVIRSSAVARCHLFRLKCLQECGRRSADSAGHLYIIVDIAAGLGLERTMVAARGIAVYAYIETVGLRVKDYTCAPVGPVGGSTGRRIYLNGDIGINIGDISKYLFCPRRLAGHCLEYQVAVIEEVDIRHWLCCGDAYPLRCGRCRRHPVCIFRHGFEAVYGASAGDVR